MTATASALEHPTQLLEGLSEVGFGAIYADPCWRFKTWDNVEAVVKRGSTKTFTSSQTHYRTMTTAEIAALPVAAHAAPDCALFMWVTWPMLIEALQVIEAWGFCVATGTRILTDDLRWINAEEAAVGQRLLCFDESLVGRRRFYRWGHVISTGIERLPCDRIILSNGQILTATKEHKWLVNSGQQYGWATTARMKETYNGRKIRKWKIPIIAPTQQFEDSFASGVLSGAFDGEGHLRHQKCGMGFSQKRNGFMDRVQSLLRERDYNFEEYFYPEHHDVAQIVIGNRHDTLRLLMQCRPIRLMESWLTGPPPFSLYNLPNVEIESIEDAGVCEVVTLQTDVGTYIAEGFGAHNTYKTCAFAWMKAEGTQVDLFQDDIKASMGMGYWTRANSEVCLLATRGKPKRLSASVRQGIIEPRRDHSRKPDCVPGRIEQLVAGPYLEMFARTRRVGWSVYGNETNKFQST